MSETSTMDFDLLRRRADEMGFFVQRHREWDPLRGNGDLYIAEKRKFREEHVDTILKYQSAAQLWKFLQNGGEHG